MAIRSLSNFAQLFVKLDELALQVQDLMFAVLDRFLQAVMFRRNYGRGNGLAGK